MNSKTPSGNSSLPDLRNLEPNQLQNLLELIIVEDSSGDWEYQPAEPLQYIDSSEYCGLKRDCASIIKKEFVRIFEGEPLRWKVNIAVLVCAIGFGKSYLLSLMMTYIAHCLLCLRNPPEYFSKQGYNISPGSKLSIVNASISKDNARKVVFSEVLNKIAYNKWFLTHYPPEDRVKSELIFDPLPKRNADRLAALRSGRVYKNVCITPGSSSMTSMVGYSVFCGAMDEASLFRTQHGDDTGDMVYNAMDRRIESRFGSMGMRIIAGSPMYIGDFLERKAREIKNSNSPTGYVVRRPIWDRHQPDWFEFKKPVFHINLENYNIIENPTEYEPPSDKWIKVPKIYLEQFKSNPEGSLRDLAAIPSAAIIRFFENQELIDKNANKKRNHPINENDEFHDWFTPDPDAWYVIHIDMAMGGKLFKRLDQVEIGSNRDRKHDSCGIAMGHISGYDKEERLIISIDLMHVLQGKLERVGPDGAQFERGAIRIEEIEGWIQNLAERGFNIATITMDGFQSGLLMGSLLDKGYDVRYLSMDRKIEPYIDMKETLLSGRLDYYPHPKFIEEAKHLEKIAGKKIDHAPGSSKDIADAVAGVVHTLTVIHGGNMAKDIEVKIY